MYRRTNRNWKTCLALMKVMSLHQQLLMRSDLESGLSAQLDTILLLRTPSIVHLENEKLLM
jgi:hypothetical protein